ncbi:MAG: TauD/TfdA family dioxygenase [Acidobacteriota bacterium]|jgi:alpha-ketoglutarate-dependent taurine dioxygenase
MIDVRSPAPDRPYVTIAPDVAGSAVTALDPELLITHYKQSGALLLRGFALDVDDFRTIASWFCETSVFNESRNRKLIDETNIIQTVSLGDRAFPLHPELAREPWMPDICMFGCLKPPSVAGETLICDGIEIVKRLPAPVVDLLEARRFRYDRPATREECIYWLRRVDPGDELLDHPPTGCPYRFRRQDGAIIRYFSRPALHRPMFADELAFGSFLLFGRYARKLMDYPVFETGETVSSELTEEIKKVSDEIKVPISWRQGDVVILDNTRFMHGRNAVHDTEERLILSYFGYLKFAIPSDEEPPDAIWRRQVFRPPITMTLAEALAAVANS